MYVNDFYDLLNERKHNFLLPKFTLYEIYVIATILTSYFMRLASNEVVHRVDGRCLKDLRFTMVFAQKHLGCATPQTKWIKKLVRQTDR